MARWGFKMSMKSVPKVEKPEIIEAIGASGALGSSKNRQALFAYLLDAHFKGCLLYTSPSPRDRG